MASERVLLHFKKTSMVAPKDGQECLVFNPCDGYRIAEWYEPGNCFLEYDETLSSDLAVLWMELPDIGTDADSDSLSREIIQAGVIQVS